MRLTSTILLHPSFRERIAHVYKSLEDESIPLALYEGVRTPWRQAELYARGRTTGGGKIVTRAKAWQSFHQYGLAVDFVFEAPDGGWTWDEPVSGMWDRYHEIARAAGLEPLSSERPHVQLPWSIADLRAGRLPPGGEDTEWERWIADQAERWGTFERDCAGSWHPGAPAALLDLDARPELSEIPTPKPEIHG